MTHYLIDIRLMGSVKHQIERLSTRLSEKFNLKNMVIPHITLAGPFSTSDEKRLINDFFTICSTQVATPKYDVGVYGFFDENYIADNKDDGNVFQKNVVARFCVSQLPYEVKILQGLDLMIERTGTIYNINYVMTDDNGVQVLYLV